MKPRSMSPASTGRAPHAPRHPLPRDWVNMGYHGLAWVSKQSCSEIIEISGVFPFRSQVFVFGTPAAAHTPVNAFLAANRDFFQRPAVQSLRRWRQTACKPGSVRPFPDGMTIPLERPSPDTSRDRPGRHCGNAATGHPACRPYLVLLPVGFAVPGPLPAPRCALAAPFHPCLASRRGGRDRRSAFCCTFPGVAPAGRYPAPCFRGARTFLDARAPRSSGRLTGFS